MYSIRESIADHYNLLSGIYLVAEAAISSYGQLHFCCNHGIHSVFYGVTTLCCKTTLL
jgi:hypothetical protein